MASSYSFAAEADKNKLAGMFGKARRHVGRMPAGGRHAVYSPTTKEGIIKSLCGKVGSSLKHVRRDIVACGLQEDEDLEMMVVHMVDILKAVGQVLLPAAPFDLRHASAEVVMIIDLLAGIGARGSPAVSGKVEHVADEDIRATFRTIPRAIARARVMAR